jgi:hypothetical protein
MALAKEIILKCDTTLLFWGNKSIYYKYKSSLFGDTYYVRQGIKWVKFCDKGNAESISGFVRKKRLKPIKRVKGDRAVRCSFKSGTNEFFQDVDFDVKEATLGYVSKGEEIGVSDQCTIVSEN